MIVVSNHEPVGRIGIAQHCICHGNEVLHLASDSNASWSGWRSATATASATLLSGNNHGTDDGDDDDQSEQKKFSTRHSALPTSVENSAESFLELLDLAF